MFFAGMLLFIHANVQGTGSKRTLPGLLGIKVHGSMFASPDAVDGKVGVVGSGQGMTEFGERKRHKFEGGVASER
jgi:survival-of-motor-neuron-related-splicing factor 30